MLHSWSLQAGHCFYYSAFSSQHRSLHWNTTRHQAKRRHPLILPQSTLFRYSENITVPSSEERLQKMGEQEENRKKKNPILQDWTYGSWILVHVNSEATLGSHTLPSKAQVWNLQISAHFSLLFFLHWCTENSCRTMTDLVRKLFQICCLNQDHSNPDFSNINLAIYFQRLQFCAIFQSFPYEEGTKLEPCSYLSYGPNQYSATLQKHMHKIWWRMRPAS